MNATKTRSIQETYVKNEVPVGTGGSFCVNQLDMTFVMLKTNTDATYASTKV